MATMWFDGQVANPGAGAVIADTGQLSHNLGTVGISVVGNADVAATLVVEYRDSTNTTTLHKQEISLLASAPFTFGPFTAVFADNERLRVTNKNLIALGNVGASIFIG